VIGFVLYQNGAFSVRYEGKSRKQDKVESMSQLRDLIADGWYSLKPTTQLVAHRSHELAMLLRGCLVSYICCAPVILVMLMFCVVTTTI